MKKLKNYCSVFASIIIMSTNVHAQDLLELELPTPEPASAASTTTESAPATASPEPVASTPTQTQATPAQTQATPSTTQGATSVVNIFPIQAPQSAPVVAQQPVAVVPAPAPAPVPAPVVVVEEPAPAPEAAPEPSREPVSVGLRGMIGISRFSERSREAGHDVEYQTSIDILQPSADEVFLPYIEGGIVIDIPIQHYFAVSTGVFYSQKSNYRRCFIDTSNFKSDNAIVTRIGYIKIPGQLTLRNWTTANTRFDISAGPYVEFGIHGKVKERYVSDEDYVLVDIEKKVDVFDESIVDNIKMARVAPYKRFDFGFCFTTTFEFKRYCIGANFDMGLTDITKPEHKEGNTRTRAIGIFFGYMLR